MHLTATQALCRLEKPRALKTKSNVMHELQRFTESALNEKNLSEYVKKREYKISTNPVKCVVILRQ